MKVPVEDEYTQGRLCGNIIGTLKICFLLKLCGMLKAVQLDPSFQ